MPDVLHTKAYHETRGASFQTVAEYGLSLPMHYGNAAAEYAMLRERTIRMDRSYCGRIRLKGKHVLDLIHRLSTNDVKSLQPGHHVETVLTNDKGRLIDRITLIHRGDDFLMMTSPQNQHRVMAWLDKYIIMDDVVFSDVTGATFQITVIGTDSESLAGYSLTGGNSASDSIVRVSTPGHTPTVDLCGPLEAFGDIMKDLEAYPLVGFQTRHLAEIEDMVPASPWEINDQFNPLEIGLVGLVSFTKGCYIGQEVIARLDSRQKVSRRLCRLTIETPSCMDDKRLFFNNKEVGSLTRYAQIPGNDSIIALAIVKHEFVNIGFKFRIGNSSVAHSAMLSSVCS